MRYVILTVFLFFTFLCVAQNLEQNKIKKSRFVIFPGCDAEDDKYDCYADKLQDFITDNLSDDAKKYLIKHAKNDTIVLYANIEYDKKGKTVLNKSRLVSFVKDFNAFLIPVKYVLPDVQPALNYKGEPKTSSTALTLGFLVNKKSNIVVPLYGYQPQLEQQQFKFLEVKEKLPVHPNCNANVDYETLKTCVNDNITNFVTQSFNIELLSKSGLSAGRYNIKTSFKIDKKGKVIDIKAVGPNKIFEDEAKRILNLLPKFKPGSVRDKPIIFPYSLPIIFEVTPNNTTKD